MKLASKTLALALVLVLMLCAVPAVLAATGDAIAWDGTADLSVTVKPGETIYYSVPAGGKQVTVSVGGDMQAVDILDANGEIVATASNRRGMDFPGIIAFPDDAEGAEVIFALSVNEFGSECAVTATVGEIAYGSMDMPLNLNKQGPGAGNHFFTAAITDEWDPAYYCVYTAEYDGVLVIEHNPVGETGDYSIEIMDDEYNVIGGDAWENAQNPLISWAVKAGKTYNITIIGTAPGDEITGTLINVETQVEAISLKTPNAQIPVNAGASIAIMDGAVNPQWNGNGVTISCTDSSLLWKTEVIYNGETYIDIDGDGKICLTLEDMSGGRVVARNELTIVNKSGNDATYIFSVDKEPVEEGSCTHPAQYVEHIEAIEATCHQDGRQEYWHCTLCDTVCSDAEMTKVTNIKSLTVAPHTAEIIHHEAKAPCHENGNIEYWQCSGCDMIFLDEALTKVSNSKRVTELATMELIHVDAKEPACHEPGNIEYWYCTECGGYYTDAEGKFPTNALSVLIPAEVELVYSPAVEVSCHQDGMAEYWYCAECDCYFTDALGQHNIAKLSLVIPHTAEIIHVDAIPACHAHGNKEYWQCSDCNTVFANAELTVVSNIKNMTIPGDPGKLEHFEAVKPTDGKNGVAEHWYCSGCDCYFTDAEGKFNVAYLSLVIPATGIPATGDSIFAVVLGAMMAATGLVVLGKKKH